MTESAVGETGMCRARRKAHGFTLIELMITVAVVGVLSLIALPSFNKQIQKTRRSEATAPMMLIAESLHKCFTMNVTYVTADADGDGKPDCDVLDTTNTLDGDYQIVVSGRTATDFIITATPTSTGRQANDSRCTSFILKSNGERTATGSDYLNCW